ncbi:MAG: hypothetical protein HQM09_02440 [Candidatus Riflebacteria bacterium]|nr:hypothetical protein [Candidatus Riflebacteria bacterium]
MKKHVRGSQRIWFAFWCAMGVLSIGGVEQRLMAQDASGGADPFALPADAGGASGSAPAPTASGGDATPANPAESPDQPKAETGGGGGGKPTGTAETAPAANTSLDETEQIDVIMQASKFKIENENKDPFRPLVEKKIAMPVIPPSPKPSGGGGIPKPPPPPPPKPIALHVQGICGNDNERLAMIEFEGKFQTVTKDMVVDGKFKVVDILPDKLVIYSNKEQMRRTFPIGGGKE